ncbi:tyrosine-type recombinase/integrase [Roseovarius aestuariivivens]|uniref:tyrosine-type recombinase/integrase n=1 Tax=Roseovarius aestuariivivens TaxID=1888910 RepID=UPI00108002BF|nr:integrase arm-type DNA-binding domain-containing protein [Roseovarius aestuariivivens]
MNKPLTTDVAIRKWKPSSPGEAKSTGGRDGLYVRGWPNGSKAFYFRSATWLKIGDYPTVSLAAGRELAVVAKRLKKEGFSNEALKRGFSNAHTASELEGVVRGKVLYGLEHRGVNSVPTYDQMWEEWFWDVEPTLQEGPSRRRPRAIHEHHISPVIGARPINEIRRREVFNLLNPLFKDKPVTAGHALGHINKVFERAIVQEFCENNPTPPRSNFPKRVTKKKHHGTLPAERLPELWRWVQQTGASDSAKLTILTAMVTAHRIGVVVRVEWDHIDETTGVWTVPERTDKSTKGRMKSGRAYSLKLPSELLAKIGQLRSTSRGKYVFESPSTTGHLTENAVLKILKRFDPALTTHGFRNSIKEFCRKAEPPVPDHIADAFCDHSLKGLDASYRRFDTSIERHQLAQRLYSYLEGDGPCLLR